MPYRRLASHHNFSGPHFIQIAFVRGIFGCGTAYYGAFRWCIPLFCCCHLCLYTISCFLYSIFSVAVRHIFCVVQHIILSYDIFRPLYAIFLSLYAILAVASRGRIHVGFRKGKGTVGGGTTDFLDGAGAFCKMEFFGEKPNTKKIGHERVPRARILAKMGASATALPAGR